VDTALQEERKTPTCQWEWTWLVVLWGLSNVRDRPSVTSVTFARAQGASKIGHGAIL
jgi:hypothetical protein